MKIGKRFPTGLKLFIGLLLLSLASIDSITAQVSGSALADSPEQVLLLARYREYRDRIGEITNREENLSGAGETLDFLEDFARSRGIASRRHAIRRDESFHSYGENLRFLIEGNEDTRILMFVAYVMDPGNSASRNNSAAIAAILSILEQTGRDPEAPTLEINFLGSIDGQKGIREYLSRNSPQIPDVVYVIDSAENFGSRVQLVNGDRNIVSPLWILRYLEERIEMAGYPSGLANSRTQLYRIGLASPSVLGPLLSAELNAVGLRFLPEDTDGPSSRMNRNGEHNLVENPATIEARQLRALTLMSDMMSMTEGRDVLEQADITGLWDQHYINLNLGLGQWIIPESSYVLSIYLILAGLYVWLFIFRRRREKYARTIRKNFWNLPLLYGAMFSFIFLGSLMVSLVQGIRGMDRLWEFIPIPLFLLKTTSATLLFTLLFTVLHRTPLSKNGSFYSASAILILSIDVLIFGLININFAYYFLWALFWAFIFSVSRNRIAKVLSALLSPILIVIGVVDIIRLGEYRLIGELISLNPGINLLVAFLLLPFMLMLIRLDFLFPHPVRGRRNFALRSSAITMVLLLMINLLITLVIDPFSPENPQRVAITSVTQREEPFDGPGGENQSLKVGQVTRGSITATSYASLGDFEIDFQGIELRAEDAGTSADFGLFDIPLQMSYRTRRDDFLARSSYRIELHSAERRPRAVRIRLFTESDTSVFDSNLPYRFLTGRGEIQFISGINPPNPMIMEFTLPSSAQPRLSIEAGYEIARAIILEGDEDRRFSLVSREVLHLLPSGEDQ